MRYKMMILAYIMGILPRLIPYLITSTPFSVDSPPIIKDVIMLYSNPELKLDSNKLDGYNNFWPGSILASLISTHIIGLNPTTTTALLIPISNGLAVITLSVFLKRLRASDTARFLILSILGVIFPYSLFYAGVTKETYATTIFLTIILILIFHKNIKGAIVMPLLIASLVVTHHLTSFLFGVVTIFILLYYLNYNIPRIKKIFPIYGLLLITCFAYLHYEYLGIRGLKLPAFSLDTVLDLSSFLIFFLFIGYLITKDKNTHLRKAGYSSIILSIVIGVLAYYSLTKGYIPGQPHYGIEYFILSLEYIALVSLSMFGKEYLKTKSGEWVLLWLLGVTSILAYSILSFNLFFNGISYRLLDFALPPLVIMSGYIISCINRWEKIVTIGLFTIILIPNIVLWSDVYLNHNEYLGYNWFLPSKLDYTGRWIKYKGGINVYGDTNVNIIFSDMFNLTCKPLYNYIKNREDFNGLAILYKEMYIYGYNHNSMNYEILEFNKFAKNNNLILVDGESEVYWCG